MLHVSNPKWWRIVAFFLGTLVFPLHGGQLAVGDAIPLFSAKDQFGKEFKLATDLHYLLIGLDMATGKEANLKLKALRPDWLEQHRAAYVLDIRAMPAIARPFALHKLRQYRHRIILGVDKSLSAFPRNSERVTVLILTESRRIQEIRYWNPAADTLDTLLN